MQLVTLKDLMKELNIIEKECHICFTRQAIGIRPELQYLSEGLYLRSIKSLDNKQ